MSITLTDYRGQHVSVEAEAIQNELSALLEAVSQSCGESGTAPSQENLRRARTALLRRIDEVTK
jgi:hypothetical protein